MDNCKQYIIDFIKKHGALTIPELLDCIKAANSPKVLKKVDEEMFSEFLQEKAEVFSINSGLVCLNSVEAKCTSILQAGLDVNNGIITFSKIEDLFSKCDKGTSSYIKGSNSSYGLASFIRRNEESFFLWQSAVFCRKKYPDVFSLTCDEFKAVDFLSKILRAKGEMDLSRLASHINQAPADIKSTIDSTKPIILWDFILEKPTFFQINRDIVMCPEDNIVAEIKEKCTFTNPLIEYLVNKLAVKQGCQTINQLSSSLSQAPAEVVSLLKSRSHSDLKETISQYPSSFLLKDDDAVMLITTEDRLKGGFERMNDTKPKEADISDGLSTMEISTNAVDLKRQPLTIENGQDLIKDVIGRELFDEVVLKLKELNVNDSNVEMIYFDLGKKPVLRIASKSNQGIKYSAHELGTEAIEAINDFSEILDKPSVNRISDHLFCISGTLHTLRCHHLNERVIGVTLLYQVHCDTSLPDSISVANNFLAVPYCRSQITENIILNYLRCKSKEEVGLHHQNVVILDYNGRITGYDYTNLVKWVGKARCVYCTGVEDITKCLNEVVMLNPDCVITNCVVSQKVFDEVKQICNQGIKVIAMVPRYICESNSADGGF